MKRPVAVGELAPVFRLPTSHGTEIGLEDYRGQRNAIVWFTKGMGCPFCRQHMSQLIRGYPRFRDLRAEILEITVTPPSRAKFYAQKFPLPFPYLCDPDYRVRREWGLEWRSHSPVWYAKSFLAGMKSDHPETPEFGPGLPDFVQIHRVLADDDLGFFIVDGAGIVRYALAGSNMEHGHQRPIPSNEEIERELLRLR